LPLALKAAVFGGLLVIASGAKQSHWPLALLFILAALYFYFRPSLNVGQFFASFLVLITTATLIMSLRGGAEAIFIPLSLFLGFLFFLLLGIKNLIFVKREPFYYLLNGLLLLVIFILFFWSAQSHLFFVKYLLVFFAIAFLFKEFLNFFIPESLHSQKRNLVVWGTAFLVLQLLWVISLLPISFLNAASLSLLIMLILQDFIVHHFSGTISRQLVLRNITVFLILTLVTHPGLVAQKLLTTFFGIMKMV